jgi:hypothetical protein
MIIAMEDCFMPRRDLLPKPWGKFRGLINPAPVVMIRDHQQGGHGYPFPGKIPQHLINPAPGDRRDIMDGNH